jgi:anti-anti-sigma factor
VVDVSAETTVGGDVDVSVTTQRHDGVTVVAVEGEIDLASGGRLEQEITAALADPGTGVVVDLHGVTFLDSSGISVLLKGRRLADTQGVDYRVTGASNMVRQVLDLTGVWGHLSGEDT